MVRSPIEMISNVTGTQSMDVPTGYNYYNVVIESASAQTYTLKRKVENGSRFVTFDGNTMSGDSSVTFYLPYSIEIEVTPSSTDAYTVIVSAAKEK